MARLVYLFSCLSLVHSFSFAPCFQLPDLICFVSLLIFFCPVRLFLCLHSLMFFI
jgi:hypothetical protein